MLTLSFVVWLLGLILWGVFPLNRASGDQYGWLSDVGKVMFTVGLLAWLLQVGGFHF